MFKLRQTKSVIDAGKGLTPEQEKKINKIDGEAFINGEEYDKGELVTIKDAITLKETLYKIKEKVNAGEDITSNPEKFEEVNMGGVITQIFTATNGQSIFNLTKEVKTPSNTILRIHNHSLDYGKGYTISTSVVTLKPDIVIEAGDTVSIRYDY